MSQALVVAALVAATVAGDSNYGYAKEPRLSLVDENRKAVVAGADATAWCPGTPWPAPAAGEGRRVVLVLRGEIYRSEATTYSKPGDSPKVAAPCSSEDWIEPQLATARHIVQGIIEPLEARGLAVDILAAPSNPRCAWKNHLYAILAGASRRRVIPIEREATNQGQGVRNALEALRQHAAAPDAPRYDYAMFWRFDGKPLRDPRIFERGAEKVLVDIIGHARLTEIAHPDHAYWFPWPALSCWYAAIHNQWPRLEDRCMHVNIKEDENADTECVLVDCFPDGQGDGHSCLEALQERIVGWESRMDTFENKFSLAEFHDLPARQELIMENWDQRWWRFSRESITGNMVVVPMSVTVDGWRDWAEQTESDDLEWWNDVAENLQRTRDRQNKKREAARRRLGRTEEAAEAPTATEAATRNADAPPATEAAANRNADAPEATRATRNAAAAATEAAANRNADAPEATEAAQRHDAPRRSTEPPTEEYQRDREQKKEAARRRIAEARAAKQAAVAAENAMKERAAADENRRQRRFDAAYAQILAAEQAVVANEFARVRSEAPSEDSRAALDALDRVAAVAREKALSEPTPPRPARLSRKTTDFVAFDAQRNWS
mmetsp:Transcript_4674/g.14133  ORF Transcript_4674/g.14133 Transcript_4674/m.14133 type:complete len:609 (-) Transcript_4674:18-1844(-)